MSSQYPPPPPEPQGGYPGMPAGGAPGPMPGPGSMPGTPGPMPGAPGAMPGPPAPAGHPDLPRPQSVSNAVRLMYVGAALSLVGLLLTPMTADAVRTQIEDAMAGQDAGLTPSQIDAFVTLATVMGIVFGLIGVGLWLLMAWANGKGRSWARIVATVLFALSAVSLLTSLPQLAVAPLPVALSALTTLVGAAAIYFLWRKDSSAWFQAQSAPRY